MNESFNVLKTGRYEAWVKAEQATVSVEADRQREEWNLGNEAQKSKRGTAGQNESEPVRSIVMHTSGNGMGVYIESIILR